jgi:hypothetical protein
MSEVLKLLFLDKMMSSHPDLKKRAEIARQNGK